MPHISEYDVETKFIDRLESICYEYVDLKNYDDVLDNFRTQLAAFNAAKLAEAKGTASFSDAEFNRIMIHLDNHSVYKSAKLLRDKYILSLDNGRPSIWISFHLILTETSTRWLIRLRWTQRTRMMSPIKTTTM